MNARRSDPDHPRSGFFYGLGAYGLWGILPIYFKLIPSVSAFAIVSHRVAWSLPFLALLVLLTRRWSRFAPILRDRRTIAILLLSAAMIGINWVLYTWSVVSGHILAASFGYFLNPLANVLLGRFVLGERLSRLQWTAVAIAAAGVSVLAIGALDQLWISLTLCVTFAIYGLLRKVVKADALTGLAFETAILAPLAALYLVFLAQSGGRAWAVSDDENALLLLAGIATTTPLLLFTAAARRLPYSTLGMLQFLAPTLQFLIAVLLYREAFTLAHAVAFGAIWTALAFYVTSLLTKARLPQPPE
jgi:chloramphenicol-sensitive protein RarD